MQVTQPLYQQSGANIAFWVLLGLLALGEYARRIRSGLNRSGSRAERWSLLIVVVGIVGGLLGGLALASGRTGTVTVGQWPLFVLGLMLMATGVAIRQWAIFVLGRFFTADVRVDAQQTVVHHGPYRWVLHPSYSGMIRLLRRPTGASSQVSGEPFQGPLDCPSYEEFPITGTPPPRWCAARAGDLYVGGRRSVRG